MSAQWKYTAEMRPVRARVGEWRFWTWFALGSVGFWLQSRGVPERLTAPVFSLGIRLVSFGLNLNGPGTDGR